MTSKDPITVQSKPVFIALLPINALYVAIGSICRTRVVAVGIRSPPILPMQPPSSSYQEGRRNVQPRLARLPLHLQPKLDQATDGFGACDVIAGVGGPVVNRSNLPLWKACRNNGVPATTRGASVPNTTAGNTLFPSGSTLLPPDPLAPEFGLHLCNDYMAPAYRKDDIVLVRALRTDERVTPDVDYLFAQRDHKTFGQTLVLLGRLTRITKTLWSATCTTA